MRLKLLSFIIFPLSLSQRRACIISESSGCNHKDIDSPTNTEQSTGAGIQQAGADLSNVESVQTEPPSKDAKQ
jgi:hypothetical protein